LPLALLACADSTGPEPTFWDYALVSVNGSAPYLSKSQIATEAEQIYDGNFGLHADGTWHISITIFGIASGGTIGPSAPQRSVVARGTWTRSGETFTLRDSSDGSTMTATHGTTNLSVVRGNDLLGFELVCWKSCGRIGF
jgi:hypothetical protein